MAEQPHEPLGLLGGYYAGRLTPEEEQTLFDAAAEDQTLFNLLMEAEAIRDALTSHEQINRIRGALARANNPPHQLRWWKQSWRLIATSRYATLAAVATVCVVLALATLSLFTHKPPAAVEVHVVNKIPLPHHVGPNPLANEKEDQVPQRPNSKNKSNQRAAAQQPPFRTHEGSSPELTAASPAALSIPHTTAVAVDDAPLGSQFRWYAALVRDQVARHWRTSDLDLNIRTAPDVAVSLTIRRDGSTSASAVRIEKPNAMPGVNESCQRAILDAAPFPPLPAAFPRDEVVLNVMFRLQR
jgi:hypothetical protein